MPPISPPLSFNPAGIELDRRQGLTRQLYEALRQRVLDGRLVSGTRLPRDPRSGGGIVDFPQQRGARLRSAVRGGVYRKPGR